VHLDQSWLSAQNILVMRLDNIGDVLPFNHGVTLKSGFLLAMLTHQLPVIVAESQDLELQQAGIVRTAKPRDVEQLTTALLEPPSDAEIGYQFSQQFSWSNIAIAHQNIYSSCLK
jgi:polysaccharide biosynthesis protein PslF